MMTRNRRAQLFLAIVCWAVLSINGPVFGWYSTGRQCHALLSMLSNIELRKAKLYYPDALIQGARDPDDRSLLQSLTHGRTEERASDSIAAACKEYEDGNLAMCAQRLARGFHYIQDRADPTKELGSDERGYLRIMAYDMLNSREFTRSQVWKQAIASETSNTRAVIDMNLIFAKLEKARLDRSNEIKEI